MTWFILGTIILIVASVILVLIILAQRPQGGGLASAFGGAGGGGTDTAFGGKTGDVLTIATIIAFVGYLLVAVFLNIMDNRLMGNAESEIQQAETWMRSKAPPRTAASSKSHWSLLPIEKSTRGACAAAAALPAAPRPGAARSAEGMQKRFSSSPSPNDVILPARHAGPIGPTTSKKQVRPAWRGGVEPLSASQHCTNLSRARACGWAVPSLAPRATALGRTVEGRCAMTLSSASLKRGSVPWSKIACWMAGEPPLPMPFAGAPLSRRRARSPPS